MAALNKKVLCFLDEYGTAGTDAFYLGVVIVLACEAGRFDKCFSDLLEPNVNEIHAVDLKDNYLQGLLQRFWAAVPKNKIVLINQKVSSRGGDASLQYAQAVVETVKIGVKRFQRDVLNRATIGNIDVIIDVNHQNENSTFDEAIKQAKAKDGRFRGVNRISRLDSAASRLLQLADVVAYSRKWIVGEHLNASGLREAFGIQIP